MGLMEADGPRKFAKPVPVQALESSVLFGLPKCQMEVSCQPTAKLGDLSGRGRWTQDALGWMTCVDVTKDSDKLAPKNCDEEHESQRRSEVRTAPMTNVSDCGRYAKRFT